MSGPGEVGETPTSQQGPEIPEKTDPCFCPYQDLFQFTVTKKICKKQKQDGLEIRIPLF